MSTYFVKYIYVNPSEAELRVSAKIPNVSLITMAFCTINSAREAKVSKVIRAKGNDEGVELQMLVNMSELEALSDAELAQAEALADDSTPCRGSYLVVAPEDVSDEVLLAGFDERAACTGPGELPAGSCFEITAGGQMAKGEGGLPWSSIPPDEVWGDCGVDAVDQGKFRMVLTRETQSIPGGSNTSVTCSRGTASEVSIPFWTQTTGEYPIGILKANSLSGKLGSATYEWTENSTTQSVSKSACRVDYDDDPHTINFGSPLNLSSDVEWDSVNHVLIITDPA